MRNFFLSLIAALIAGSIVGGCSSGPLPGAVVEQHAAAAAAEIRAQDSGVFVLWHWVPVTNDDLSLPPKPAGDRPVEIREVYAPQGSLVGFRRSSSQLFAVAGTVVLPLEEGHYAWTDQTALQQQQDGKSDAANFWVAWWYWSSAPWSFVLGTPPINPQ